MKNSQFFLSFENDPIEYWKPLNISSEEELIEKQKEIRDQAFSMFLDSDRKWLGGDVPAIVVSEVCTTRHQKFTMRLDENE